MNVMNIRSLAIASVAALATFASAETPDKFVRYVESTGSQWVDTGVRGRWNTKVEAQVEWLELGDKSILGSGDWSDNTRCFMIYCNNTDGNIATALGLSPTSNGRVAYVNDGTWNSWWQTNRIYDYSAEFSATNSAGESTRRVVIDGIRFNDISATAVDSGRSLYLFSINRGGSAYSGAQPRARIYRMRIWQGPADGGDMALVRDLVPCVKGGRAGLYDAKSGEILYSGSGTDLVCDADSDTPDEFVEYVESTGINFIDTEVAARSGTSAECDVAVMHKSKYRLGLLGAVTVGGMYFDLVHSFQGRFACSYGTRQETGGAYAVGSRYRVESSLAAGTQTLAVAAEGSSPATVYGADDAAAIDTGLSLYLFGRNQDGNMASGGAYRLYGLKIRQDGALVRDFRPCLKGGAFALYDAVSKRIFHPKRGLLNGPVRQTRVRVGDLVFVDYIESSGDETLDTGVRARAGTRAKGEFAWTEDYTGLTKRYEVGRYLKAPIYRNARTFLGADDATDWPSFFYMIYAEDQCFAGYCGNGLGNNSVPYGGWAMDGSAYVYAKTPLERHSFDATFMDGEQTIELDGTQVWSLANDGNFDTGRNLHIFSTGSRYRSAARCYGLEIWQNGDKVRDFRPCIYQGTAALYDTVSQCVFRPSPDIPASKTGGVVLTGDEKPDCYVDYVESDGTIFVDTGVKGKSGTAAETRMAFLEKKDAAFLDARRGDSRFYLLHNLLNYNVFGYGYGAYQTIGSGSAGTIYNILVSLASGAQTAVVDGVAKIDASDSSTIDTDLNLYLFAMDQDGVPAAPGKARLYSLKLWQGGADGSNMRPVRNFKPVRLRNGLVVLWDFANEKPYLPQVVSSPGSCVQFPAVGPDGEKVVSAFTLIVR